MKNEQRKEHELIEFEKIDLEEVQEVDEVVTAAAGTVYCCQQS